MDEIRKTEDEIRGLQKISAEFGTLREYQGPDRVVHIKEIIEELKEKHSFGPWVKGPFGSLERLLGGFYPGQLIVVSGPTGHGKTSLVKSFTKSFLEEGEKSLWFSYEAPPMEFSESFPGELNLYIPRELNSGRLDWIEQRIAESLVKYRTSVVFIDHLHFLVDLKALAASRNQSILIGILLRQLKQIALKYNVIIFLVAHIRKLDLEEAAPTIDDLRDSSFVGQESDIVIFIWRKFKTRSRKEIRERIPIEWTNEARIEVVKNRRLGSLGGFDVAYNLNTYEFTEIDQAGGNAGSRDWTTS